MSVLFLFNKRLKSHYVGLGWFLHMNSCLVLQKHWYFVILCPRLWFKWTQMYAKLEIRFVLIVCVCVHTSVCSCPWRSCSNDLSSIVQRSFPWEPHAMTAIEPMLIWWTPSSVYLELVCKGNFLFNFINFPSSISQDLGIFELLYRTWSMWSGTYGSMAECLECGRL